MSTPTPSTDDAYDVIVVGSGAGLVGAYIAASRGLRTLLIEKTEFIGGTTAYSGAGIWLPGNAAELRGGVSDATPEAARAYLDAIVGDAAPAYLREAYLAAGPQLIDELEQNPLFGAFFWYGVPDYFAGQPGSHAVGHTIFPAELPASELGELASLLRPALWTERWGVDAGEVLSGGRALIARALLAFVGTGNGEVRTDTALEALIVEDGVVVGIEAVTEGRTVQIRADAVLLASGGFERNRELRQKYQPAVITDEWTQGCPGNTGAALQAGIAAGAATDLLDESWFVPGLVVPDNRPVFWTSSWSGIYVNAAGQRFMNENLPYDQAGHMMLQEHLSTGVDHIPTHWVFDQRQVDGNVWQLPVGPDVPGWFDADKWVEAGVLKRADSLAELAELIGVPAGALEKSVDEFNGFAYDGVDTSFHRGEAPWDKYIVTGAGAFAGLPPHQFGPNPCLAPIDSPPFYAATLVVSDLGTKGGLKTDAQSRVVRPDGSIIKGLYASGNAMAPMTGRVYPGAGGPIGSSMTFSYLAALEMAGQAG